MLLRGKFKRPNVVPQGGKVVAFGYNMRQISPREHPRPYDKIELSILESFNKPQIICTSNYIREQPLIIERYIVYFLIRRSVKSNESI